MAPLIHTFLDYVGSEAPDFILIGLPRATDHEQLKVFFAAHQKR